ncbi:MAG: translocation/assembly module TamB domain-containing protein, partial [Ferruginibacter sp.]
KNDFDYMHIINWQKAEAAVKAGKATKHNGINVIPMQTAIDEGFLYLVKEKALQPSPQQVTDPAKSLNYDLDILSDPRAALTIIMDPSTGDEMTVNGKAHLNAAIDTAGRMAISGTYMLDSGYYRMNYQYLSKQFNVLPGSTITFHGEPANAGLNIRALYIANTSPMDLLGNEVGVIDRRLLKSFYKKIPFEVILKLKGLLKEPLIGFDIQLPPKEIISSDLKYTIENKLVQLRDDASATNKQVFALLMLDRFVGEQSADFFKGNGSPTGFSNNTTVSVSQFLSSALDEIASDLFTGINVDLNLNSYKDFMVNDGAHKTDLGVEVSKSFLDDRLNITVGRTYGIESQDGSAKAAQQKGSRFLPDVTVNYKLSKDGKYKLRSYKKDPFEVILDGYVVETGLAFIITMDLESYKALFLKKDN